MAVLKSFDFTAARTNTRLPWDVLTNGQIHKLVKVESAGDVKNPSEQFYQKYFTAQVRVYAKQNGKTVKIGRDKSDKRENVVLQFVNAKKVNKKAPVAAEAPAETK